MGLQVKGQKSSSTSSSSSSKPGMGVPQHNIKIVLNGPSNAVEAAKIKLNNWVREFQRCTINIEVPGSQPNKGGLMENASAEEKKSAEALKDAIKGTLKKDVALI